MSTVLPGHSIPYSLSPSEIETFLSVHRGDPALSNYIFTKDPPYGIIVKDGYGDLLVWYDASGSLHVVDVTNMSIATEVQRAPFESPDSSIIDNLIQQIQTVASAGVSLSQTVLWIVGGLVVLQIFDKIGKK